MAASAHLVADRRVARLLLLGEALWWGGLALALTTSFAGIPIAPVAGVAVATTGFVKLELLTLRMSRSLREAGETGWATSAAVLRLRLMQPSVLVRAVTLVRAESSHS